MPFEEFTGRVMNRVSWFKQDLAAGARRFLGSGTDTGAWGNAPRTAGDHHPPKVWLVAGGGVASMYMALRCMRELTRRRADVVQWLFLNAATPTEFLDRALLDGDHGTERVLPLPQLLTHPVRRALSAARPEVVLAVGLAPNKRIIRLASHWRVPLAWVSAERPTPPSGSRADRRMCRSFDVVCADSEESRENLVASGVAANKVRVLGTAKYDVAAPFDGQIQRARDVLRQMGAGHEDMVLVGASLALGEMRIMARALGEWKRQRPRLLLILAPRGAWWRTAKGRSIVDEIRASGWTVCRRSELQPSAEAPHRPDVLVLDTVGELKGFYAVADVVFMGRSLTHDAGANVIEPAGQGRAIVTGPNAVCFREVFGHFLAADAIVRVIDESQLVRAVSRLLMNPALRAEYGGRAREVVQNQQGVIGRSLDYLAGLPRFAGTLSPSSSDHAKAH